MYAVERPPDGLRRGAPEDALGGRLPLLDAIVGRARDDGLAGRRNRLLEPLLGVGDLTVEPGVPQGDRQVLREHLEELALPRIDPAPRGSVVDDEVPEQSLDVPDHACDDGWIVLVAIRRNLRDDLD